jgi:hypothetical protein
MSEQWNRVLFSVAGYEDPVEEEATEEGWYVR